MSSHIQNVTDELLMHAVQGGQVEALGELFERHHRAVFLFLRRTTGDAVRTQIDRIRQKCGSAFVVFGWTEDEGKVPLIAALTNDLVKKGLKAGDIVKQVAAIVGGSGGGKPDMAQAGGKDAAKLPEALLKAEALGKELLAK